MKVKTRLYLSSIISIGLVGVLVFMALFSSSRIAEEEKKHDLAISLQMAVSELDIVTYEYLLHQEERMERQGNLRYDSMKELLEKEEEESIKSLYTGYIAFGNLFSRVAANYKERQSLIREGASQEKIDSIIALGERLTAQLLIESHSIITDAFRVAKDAHADLLAIQELTTKLTLIVVLVIVITMVATTLFVARSISKPLNKLTKGTEIIGKGNFKHRIKIKSKDEIGQLAGAFNQMTVELEQKIKELKEAIKKLKELDKLKDEFLNTTTHELKTPLIPIKSQTQLLLAGDYGELNKEQEKAVEMILRNEKQLQNLVGDVLDITKVKSKKLELVLRKAGLDKIIAGAVKNVEAVAEKKFVSLTLKPIPQLSKVSIDEKRITQVIDNLLDNALKFTPENGEVVVKMKKEKNNIIIVSVKDTGIGVSRKNLKKLFTPFFQVESDITRKYGGTGLGLSICKGIIEQHGGKIWAESLGKGRGSTFSFSLPLRQKG